MKKEEMSSDEIFKPLSPSVPEKFYFGLFNCMSLYIPFSLAQVLLYFLKFATERDSVFHLWKASNTKLVNGEY